MKRLKNVVLMLGILFSVAGCDHATKLAAVDYLSNNSPMSLFADTVVLQYVENAGAFLSFGTNFPESIRFFLFIILPSLVICVLFIHVMMSQTQARHQIIGFSLIIGGSLGNLCDRIFRSGHVIDFLNIGIGPIRTGIFNVADVALMIGFGLLVFPILKCHCLKQK